MSAPSLSQKVAAETVATFLLVFAGTGAVVADQFSGGAVTHVGVALTFGLIVLTMIEAVGDVSGAHLNPAVTFGFWVAGRLPGRHVLPYVAAQCGGAIAASATLRLLFPTVADLGVTRPAIGTNPSLVLEGLLTFLLMFVILGVATGAKEKGITAGITVGACIALEALFAGPATGASMNPARSLAPALVAAEWSGLWVYLLGPPVGAAVAVPLYRFIRPFGPAAQA